MLHIFNHFIARLPFQTFLTSLLLSSKPEAHSLQAKSTPCSYFFILFNIQKEKAVFNATPPAAQDVCFLMKDYIIFAPQK